MDTSVRKSDRFVTAIDQIDFDFPSRIKYKKGEIIQHSSGYGHEYGYIAEDGPAQPLVVCPRIVKRRRLDDFTCCSFFQGKGHQKVMVEVRLVRFRSRSL